MVVSPSIKKTLDRLYRDVASPGSLGGVKALFQSARDNGIAVTKDDVRSFLAGKRSYTLHRIQAKRFLRRKTIARGPRIIIQSDLADMTQLSRQNNGIKYLLVVIDVFSRYLAIRPLKGKDKTSVKNALRSILDQREFESVSRLQTDRGKEFYNSAVGDLLAEHKIKLYSTFSQETKASIAERVIRTIKGKIYRYMTEENKRRYIDILPELVRSYNKTRHSTLGARPIDIHSMTDRDEILQVFNKMYRQKNKKGVKGTKSQHSLTVGDTVRITLNSRTGKFFRGFHIANTEEIFKISVVDTTQDVTGYFLEDLEGEPLKGIFYRHELIKTNLPEFYPIQVLRRRRNRITRREEFLVKWVGYPQSGNSWVSKSDIRNYVD